MNIDRLISVKDVLPLIGKGLTGFYAELKAGHLTAIKQGKRTFVAESEIARYRATLKTIGRLPDATSTAANNCQR